MQLRSQQRDRERQHQDGCHFLPSGCQDLPAPGRPAKWPGESQTSSFTEILSNRGKVTRGVLVPGNRVQAKQSRVP